MSNSVRKSNDFKRCLCVQKQGKLHLGKDTITTRIATYKELRVHSRLRFYITQTTCVLRQTAVMWCVTG